MECFVKTNSSSANDGQWPFPFSREDWEKTPETVRAYTVSLQDQIADLEKTKQTLSQHVDELNARLNRNSSNSDQPPSSDSPYKKRRKRPTTGKKPGGKKGHKGHRQVMLAPTQTEHLKPECCTCGNKIFRMRFPTTPISSSNFPKL
jgi:transposase